jgi:hypothetical protein
MGCTGSDGDDRRRVGVEHELQLWRGHEQVDFRQWIATLAGTIRPLDPGDPRARRLPSGVAVTADGREAELATPPLPVDDGAADRTDQLLRTERTELRDRAAAYGVDGVTGFSTHLNVSVPDDEVVAIGHRLARTCLTSLAALTEPPGSMGVFVRPRRGRLEVGCDYVEGWRLIAALELLTACVEGLASGSSGPTGPAPRLMPSREKFGWFLSPQQVAEPDSVERLWEWARPWAERLGLDVARLDSELYPVRRPSDEDDCTFGRTGPAAAGTATQPRAVGRAIAAETEWLTWHHVVWRFRHRSGHTCRAVVPAWLESSFLTGLADGAHDLDLSRMLRPSVAHRSLLVSAQLGPEIQWFHEVRPGALVPAERLPDGSLPRVSRRAARRQLRHSLRSTG